MKTFDLVIVGAGIAGLSAALTAAGHGLNIALVEKHNDIGGTAQDCFHPYLCGLFTDDDAHTFQIANPGINTTTGICTEIFNFLYGCYGEKCLVKMGRVQVMAFAQKDLWGYFYSQLKQKRVNFFKCVECANTVHAHRKIQSLKVCGSETGDLLAAPVFINATGKDSFPQDSPLTHSAVECNEQLGGYCLLLQGESQRDLSLIVPYIARKIVKKYALAAHLKFITISRNFLTKEYVLKFSVKSDQDIETCDFIFQQLRDNINELSRMEYLLSSEKIHPRGCEHTQYYNHAIMDEHAACAVKSYWPKENWDMDSGPRYEYCKNGQPFRIPFSALKDENFDNLFLAGKNIRVPLDIHTSARVMGICMATGEQAALSAIRYLKNN